MLLRLAFVPIWIAALWGSLQLHQLDLNLGHSICGAWGCGPPIEALLGYHGFWLALIIPATAYLGSFLPQAINRRLGFALLCVGLVGIVGFVGRDAILYARKVESTEFLAQRAFFTLVTTVDVPMMQTFLAGGLLFFVFGRPRTLGVDELTSAVAVTESGSPVAAS